MKELIEKLIGRLRKYETENYNFYSENGLNTDLGRSLGAKEIIKIVNQLAEDYNNGWISVSERLPDEATTYQVTEEVVINNRKQYVVDIRLFGTEGEWLCPSNRKIIAWMPLPEPYQPNNKKCEFKEQQCTEKCRYYNTCARNPYRYANSEEGAEHE